MSTINPVSTRFQRIFLPGFLFQSVMIGGGYATGRELVEFFLSAGPVGGLLGLLAATLGFSAIAALSFEFARITKSYNYRHFFKQLLGNYWFLFEIAYFILGLLVLAVIGAAAGETSIRWYLLRSKPENYSERINSVLELVLLLMKRVPRAKIPQRQLKYIDAEKRFNFSESFVQDILSDIAHILKDLMDSHSGRLTNNHILRRYKLCCDVICSLSEQKDEFLHIMDPLKRVPMVII